MSTRPNPLKLAMQAVQHSPAAPVPPPILPVSTGPAPMAPSRLGKRAIGGHFEPTVGRQLKLLAADQDRSVQDLLAEALNDLFRKYNKSAIATE